MPIEIERRFFVTDTSVLQDQGIERIHIHQYYVCNDSEKVIRIRIAEASDATKAYLTIKIKSGIENACHEYEYEIPVRDAVDIITKLGTDVNTEKIRYLIPVGDLVWEVDVFLGHNEGLIIAEVELDDVRQEIEIPKWVGMEISNSPIKDVLSNVRLATYPIDSWSVSQRKMLEDILSGNTKTTTEESENS